MAKLVQTFIEVNIHFYDSRLDRKSRKSDEE